MSDDVCVKVNSYGPGRPLGLVYFDPISGRKKAKSSGTTAWREAERLAGELEKELRAGLYVSPSRITWADFRKRYETERLPGLSESYRNSVGSAFNHLERVLNPDRLAKLTTASMSQFVAKLRAGGMKDSTLACHLRGLAVGLHWAKRLGLLATLPLGLLAEDLDEHAFRAAAVELAVEDLLPRAEIELPAGNRHDDFPAHDLPLVVRVGVVFAGAVVTVALGRRVEGGQLLQPALVVFVQPRLVVVDEHARRDVHRVAQKDPLLDAALPDGRFDLGRDVQEVHSFWNFEGKVLGVRFHVAAPCFGVVSILTARRKKGSPRTVRRHSRIRSCFLRATRQ